MTDAKPGTWVGYTAAGKLLGGLSASVVKRLVSLHAAKALDWTPGGRPLVHVEYLQPFAEHYVRWRAARGAAVAERKERKALGREIAQRCWYMDGGHASWKGIVRGKTTAWLRQEVEKWRQKAREAEK